jgi:hypothetical protein
MNPSTFFSRKVIGAILVVALIGVVIYFYTQSSQAPEQIEKVAVADYKNIAYTIEGQQIKLSDGIAETEAVPGSTSKVITRYFGNELKTDLNGDGRDDVVFLLTQQRGGSGTFFYAVAALNMDNGYVGSDGYLLGDRIAPQSMNVSQNPKQKYVIVVNYADRASGEPMTASPGVGKSAYLKLDTTTMQWGIVVPNFEGESR